MNVRDEQNSRCNSESRHTWELNQTTSDHSKFGSQKTGCKRRRSIFVPHREPACLRPHTLQLKNETSGNNYQHRRVSGSIQVSSVLQSDNINKSVSRKKNISHQSDITPSSYRFPHHSYLGPSKEPSWPKLTKNNQTEER